MMMTMEKEEETLQTDKFSPQMRRKKLSRYSQLRDCKARERVGGKSKRASNRIKGRKKKVFVRIAEYT